jgi:DNA repair protein RadC
MLIKPADVLKAVEKENNKKNHSLLIFYLDINKKIISVHKKDYLNEFDLTVSNIFIPAFYLGAKFIVIANVLPDNFKFKVSNTTKALVKKIFKVSCSLNIFLLDYLIINKDKYYSFHESNIL